MGYGRINQPLQVPNSDLLLGAPETILDDDTPSGTEQITVKNSEAFVAPFGAGNPQIVFVVIGEPGNLGTELIQIVTIDSTTQITLAAETKFPHSASTKVYGVPYDEIEFNVSENVEGDPMTLLSNVPIAIDQSTTIYDDMDDSHDDQYYFARFKNSTD